MDDSGDTPGALATWCNRACRGRIDPFAAGHRCGDSCHQSVDGKTSSLNLRSGKVFGLWPLKTPMSDML